MNLEFTKPQNLGSLLMKSSQSNLNLQLPGSYLVRSCLITTVHTDKSIDYLRGRFIDSFLCGSTVYIDD